MRITHNWIAPDGFKQATNGVRLSDSRYWKVETIWQAGTHASATLTYSGIVSSTNTLAFLDHTWLTNGEDSLILFYRSSPADEWEEVDGYTLITGSLIDKKGTVELDTLKPGEYTLGTHDASYISRGDQLPPNSFVLYPNPADEIVSIRLEIAEPVAISIHDLRGGLQYFKQQSTKKRTELIKIGHFSSGTYIVSIRDKRGFTASKRLILAK